MKEIFLFVEACLSGQFFSSSSPKYDFTRVLFSNSLAIHKHFFCTISNVISDDLTGDILQFGVDVMENSRKVTHGCIIATLKLYLPDGKEAKASPTIVNSTSNPALLSLSLPTQDLYQLNQYIQEALAREQVNCDYYFLH